MLEGLEDQNDFLKIEPATSLPYRHKVALTTPGIQRQRGVQEILGKGSKVWLISDGLEASSPATPWEFSIFPLYVGTGELKVPALERVSQIIISLFPFVCRQQSLDD